MYFSGGTLRKVTFIVQIKFNDFSMADKYFFRLPRESNVNENCESLFHCKKHWTWLLTDKFFFVLILMFHNLYRCKPIRKNVKGFCTTRNTIHQTGFSPFIFSTE